MTSDCDFNRILNRVSVKLFITGVLLCLSASSIAQSRCTQTPVGGVTQVVWNNGAQGDNWQAPAAVSGGASLALTDRVSFQAITPYAKIKLTARSPVKGMRWLSLRIRSDSPAKISVYLYSSQLGDTYSSRCVVNTTPDWRVEHIPLSAIGARVASGIEQIRFRNETTGQMRFELANIALLGDKPVTPPVTPTDNKGQLPARSRLAYWHESAGVSVPSTQRWRQVTVPLPASGRDASATIQAALDQQNNIVVNLEPGTYTIKQTLRIQGRNKLLRGASRSRSTLLFEGIQGNGINIGGHYKPGASLSVLRGNKGSRTLNVDSARQAQTLLGAVVEIDQLRDTLAFDEPNRDTASGGPLIHRRGNSDRGPGQMNQVVAVSGRTLRLKDRLILSYNKPQHAPQVRRVTMYARNVGVQRLKFRGRQLERLSSAIFAKAAQGVWIQGINSIGTAGKSHVDMARVYQCTVAASLFDNAVKHSNGGAGYGTNIHDHSTACLIENNVFRRLRHSIVLNGGAAGNALLYNYSDKPIHPNYKSGGPADISFHGGYVSGNLVEGNVVQRISMTDDCCRAEKYNTLLRNCILRSPITLRYGSNTQNIIGNATYGSDALMRQTMITGGTVAGVTVTGGTPALRPGESAMFDTGNGKDGIYIYPNDPRSRFNEKSRDINTFGHWHLGQRWFNNRPSTPSRAIPGTYYYRSEIALRRSWFNRAPSVILDSPSGDANLDCRIPASIRAL